MRRGYAMDNLVTLLLFGLFAGSVLMVLMMGVRSYQSVSTTVTEQYEERTCLQYIATKVAHYSGEDGVGLAEFGGSTALVLGETIDGCDYVTYLYFYDGYIRELFCERDAELDAQLGFSIMEVENLEITAVEDNLVHLSCTGSGGTAELFVALHTGLEVGT